MQLWKRKKPNWKSFTLLRSIAKVIDAVFLLPLVKIMLVLLEEEEKEESKEDCCIDDSANDVDVANYYPCNKYV